MIGAAMPVSEKKTRMMMRDGLLKTSQNSVNATTTARVNALSTIGAARSERFLRHSVRKSGACAAWPESHRIIRSKSACRSANTAE